MLRLGALGGLPKRLRRHIVIQRRRSMPAHVRRRLASSALPELGLELGLEPALEPALVLGAALALELVLELEVAHQPCSGGRSSAIPSSTIHQSFLCLATRNGCEATAGW